MALKMLHMAAITMTFRRLRKSPKKRIDDGPRGPSSIQAPRHRLWPAPITWECPIELTTGRAARRQFVFLEISVDDEMLMVPAVCKLKK